MELIGPVLALLLVAGLTVSAALRRRRPSSAPDPHTVDRVLAALPHNSVLVLGPDDRRRRALLAAVVERLRGPDPHLLAVPVDLAGVGADELFPRLGSALAAALGRSPPGDGRRLGPRSLRRLARAWLDHHEAGVGHPVVAVLVVDHLDQADAWDALTRQRLRSLFMGGLGDRLVVAAAAADLDRTWSEAGSPWYNFFAEIELEAASGRWP